MALVEMRDTAEVLTASCRVWSRWVKSVFSREPPTNSHQAYLLKTCHIACAFNIYRPHAFPSFCNTRSVCDTLKTQPFSLSMTMTMTRQWETRAAGYVHECHHMCGSC
jgi:hypothetical protein